MIGDKIKQIRKDKNISQKDFAKILKMPVSTLANYENNHREPNIETLRSIAKALEVDLNQLLYEKEALEKLEKMHVFFDGLHNTNEDIDEYIDEDIYEYRNTNYNNSIQTLKFLADKVDNHNLKEKFKKYLNDISSHTYNELNIDKIDSTFNQKINPIINKLVDTLELEVYKLLMTKDE